mgnify:CR=1
LRATLEKMVCKCGFASPGGGENGELKVIECAGLSCLLSRLKKYGAAKPEFIQFSNDALTARQVSGAHQYEVAT